jgi:hypothetical protein
MSGGLLRSRHSALNLQGLSIQNYTGKALVRLGRYD